MNKGWMLVKPKFQESYETQRLLEEFGNHNIEVKLIDPNEIDIFVNKENKQSILVNGKSLPLPKFVFPRTGSGTTKVPSRSNKTVNFCFIIKVF